MRLPTTLSDGLVVGGDRLRESVVPVGNRR